MPLVIILHVFHNFFIVVYFPKKENSWAYHITFLFYFCLHPLSTMLGILTLLFFEFCANTFPHSTTSAPQPPCPSPPTPLQPEVGAACLAILVDAALANYILPMPHRATNVKRSALMCCKLNPQLHPIA